MCLSDINPLCVYIMHVQMYVSFRELEMANMYMYVYTDNNMSVCTVPRKRIPNVLCEDELAQIVMHT